MLCKSFSKAKPLSDIPSLTLQQDSRLMARLCIQSRPKHEFQVSVGH